MSSGATSTPLRWLSLARAITDPAVRAFFVSICPGGAIRLPRATIIGACDPILCLRHCAVAKCNTAAASTRSAPASFSASSPRPDSSVASLTANTARVTVRPGNHRRPLPDRTARGNLATGARGRGAVYRGRFVYQGPFSWPCPSERSAIRSRGGIPHRIPRPVESPVAPRALLPSPVPRRGR